MPIPPFLSDALKSLLEGKEPDDLVFAGIRNGEPLRVSTFSGSFKAAVLAIGLPKLHPHQLRHTAASLAIAAGADVKVVQQMLGHASAAMTLDVYGHLFEDRLDEVGTAMHHVRAAAHEARSSLTMAGGVDSDAAPARPQIPTADSREKAEGPSALRFRSSEGQLMSTPDRIRTGATALRGRRARPLHNGGKHVNTRGETLSKRLRRSKSRPGAGISLGY